jgi:hypothetical protein
VCPGVNRQFGPGTDRGPLRRQQDLVRGGIGQGGFPNFHLKGFDDDRLPGNDHKNLGPLNLAIVPDSADSFGARRLW